MVKNSRVHDNPPFSKKKRCVMSGIITFKDVVVHPVLVVSEYGWVVYLRCAWAAITRSKVTFLSIVMMD
jgi:hypothetical protein